VNSYPLWKYYPPRQRPPGWVSDVVTIFDSARAELDSRTVSGTKSDAALGVLRPGLVKMGFDVEAGKKKADKIRRPVLFGELGSEDLAYEVDAFHPGLGIALEVEAGRGARGNAVYRDLIQTSLLADATYLVLAVAQEYRHKLTANPAGAVVQSYRDSRRILDAIYASTRLQRPLEGILLVGY
jgi:hypothetical protein